MIRLLKYSVFFLTLLAGGFLQTASAVDLNASTIKPLPVVTPAQALRNQHPYDEAAVLRADNKRLKGVITTLNQRIADFQNNKRFCSDLHTSATKAGVRQECYPYNCDQVTGTCLITAHDSYDCVQGRNLLWDVGGKCVDATTHQ